MTSTTIQYVRTPEFDEFMNDVEDSMVVLRGLTGTCVFCVHGVEVLRESDVVVDILTLVIQAAQRILRIRVMMHPEGIMIVRDGQAALERLTPGEALTVIMETIGRYMDLVV